MDFVVSRTSYCPHCHKATRPLEDNIFLTHGTSTQTYIVNVVHNDSTVAKRGFTPHIWFKLGVEQLPSGIFVRYRKVCGIVKCGLDMDYEKDSKRELLTFSKHTDVDDKGKPLEYTLYYYLHRWTKGMMPVNDWNSMIRDFKDESYWLEDR